MQQTLSPNAAGHHATYQDQKRQLTATQIIKSRMKKSASKSAAPQLELAVPFAEPSEPTCRQVLQGIFQPVDKFAPENLKCIFRA